MIDPHVRLALIGTHLRSGNVEAALAVLCNTIREARSEGWDEAANEAYAKGWLGPYDQIDMRWANPHREEASGD